VKVARKKADEVEKEEEDDREPEDIMMEMFNIPMDVRHQSVNMRLNMTRLEKKVWGFLGKHENPWGFLRQWPAEGYFLDFWSQHFNVCLEVDGPHHFLRLAEDLKRDKVLAKKGIRTIRLRPADFQRMSTGELFIYVRNAVENADPKAEG
jgi:very-short-patch-repair endonuclease